MSMSGETIGYGQFLDQIASKLRGSATGQEVFGLRERELKGLMDGVVSNLLVTPEAKEKGVKAQVNSNVKLGPTSGTVAAKVNVLSPISGNLDVNCVLENDKAKKGSLRLAGPVQVKESFILKAALRAAGIDPAILANKELADPNTALFKFLKVEFQQRGLNLTAINLVFTKDLDEIFRLKAGLTIEKKAA